MENLQNIWINDPKKSWTLIAYKSSEIAISKKKHSRQTSKQLVEIASLQALGQRTTYTLADDSTLTIPDSDTSLYNESHSKLQDDLCELDNMHAASVLNLIGNRYMLDKVYSSMGGILLAVNPYCRISGLYDLPPADASAPHIFQISGRAYEALWNDDKNQGKYSKRRSNNDAVIVVRIVLISSFFLYCLLLNHSFQTNPNRITNCFKLFSLYCNFTNYICSMRSSIFDFWNSYCCYI